MYQVDWKPEAEQELAAIWLASADRNGLSFAAHEIDKLLSREPLAIGESRSSSVHRVAFCNPLCVEYLVIEDDKKVIVQHAKST